MISIERIEFSHFVMRYTLGEFGSQRFGQAFFNHFELHKMDKTNNPWLDELWEASIDDAMDIINEHFFAGD